MPKDNGMFWIPDIGLGYCSNIPPPNFYSQSYWDEYVRRADTSMGRQITELRCKLVQKYLADGPLLDVGIGCGHFIETRGKNTFGYDINPIGINWLRDRGLFYDPRDGFPNMTFWDVLEHVSDASNIMKCCTGYAFVTLPIFRDEAHCRESRHFKPGEHIWYFTHKGLIRWAKGLGFELVEHNTKETEIGRQDIETFVFKRVA